MPDYTLVPTPLPPAGRRGASSVYRDIVEDFIGMQNQSVRVEYDRKPATVYISLKRVVRSDPRYASIKVSVRGDQVFLVKE